MEVYMSRYKSALSVVATLARWSSTVALLLCLVSQKGYAQSPLREALFEDCQRATEIWSGLPQTEQIANVEYLADVVKLNTQVPDFAGAFYVPPGGGQNPANLAPGALWQAVDARRELEAKRCALEILHLAGPTALSALPSLVETYTEENLGDEIAVGVEETAFLIAEASLQANTPPSPASIDFILSHLSKPKKLIAHNILLELGDLAIPRILLALGRVLPSEVDTYQTILRAVDAAHTKGIEMVVSMNSTMPSEDLERLIARLPLPEEAPSEIVVKRLVEVALSDNPVVAKPFVTLLGKMCNQYNGITISKSDGASLARRALLPITAPGFMPLQYQGCVLSEIPALIPSVLTQLESNEPATVFHGLELLPSALPQITGKQRNALYAMTKDMSKREGNEGYQALVTMASFREKGSETIGTYLALLKESVNTMSDHASQKNALLSSILYGLELLPPENLNQKSLPLLLEALQSLPESKRVIALLSKSGVAVGQSLLESIRERKFERTKDLLTVIQQQKNPTSSDIDAVVVACQEPELVDAATATLLRLGKRAKSVVRKLLPQVTDPLKGRLLALLVAQESATEKEQLELVELIVSGSCDSLFAVPESVSILVSESGGQSRASGGDPPHSLPQRIVDCLHSAPQPLMKRWLSLPAIRNKGSLQLFESVILNPNSPGSLLTEVKKILLERNLPLTNDAGGLVRILENAPREGFLTLLAAINQVGAEPTVAEAIQSGSKRFSDDTEVTLAAQWALARVSPSSVDTTPLIRERIERWGKNEDNVASDEEIRAIRSLPLDGVLSQIQVGLRSGYPPIMIGAARVAGALGASAVPVKETLQKLLKNPAPNIKYGAALALLTIDSSGEGTIAALERVLINRYYPDPHQADFFASHITTPPLLPLSTLGRVRTARLRELLGQNMELLSNQQNEPLK